MVNSNLCPALFLIDKNNCFHGVHSHITFLSHEERNGQVTRSRDSFFFLAASKGQGPGSGAFSSPEPVVSWSRGLDKLSREWGLWRKTVFVFLNLLFSISSLGSHAGVSHNYNLTLLRDMNFFIALFKLKYSAIGGLNRHKTGQVCLNIYIFVLFFSLLLNRLAVRKDQFAVLYFLQVIIVLIKVYNWEIRHHSTVRRCVLTDIL